jgi:hypothetical protein
MAVAGIWMGVHSILLTRLGRLDQDEQFIPELGVLAEETARPDIGGEVDATGALKMLISRYIVPQPVNRG